MLFHFNWPALAFILSALISLGVALLVWPRRLMKGGTLFLWISLATAWWSFCAGLEAASTSRWEDIFWAQAAYLGVTSICPLFLTFALKYTDRDHLLTRRNVILIWIIPVLTFLLAATNQLHGLVWTAIVPSPIPGSTFYKYDHGLWFWIAIAYFYLCLLAASALLLRDVSRSRPFYSRQNLAIWLALPVPWISNLIYILGLSPVPELDLTPLAFTVTNLIFSIGIYRLQLFELVPVAREAIFEKLEDGLIVVDMQQRIVDLNLSARKLLHLPDRLQVGQPLSEAAASLASYLDHQEQAFELTLETPLQTELEVHISPLVDARERLMGSLIVVRDITARKHAERSLEEKSRELEKLSLTDGLTQAFNWRYAEQALAEYFSVSAQAGTPLTLAMFDLDDFKRINDRCGHAKGDEVLRSLADFVRSLLRANDILIRMGGDEFLIIFPNTDLGDGVKGFERLRAALANFEIPGVDLRLTLSGGITACAPGDQPADALQRADRMLYQAKDAGKNRIISDL